MTSSDETVDLVFAIDIGATSIKFAQVTSSGEVVSSVRRRPTPYPCMPNRLTGVLAHRIVASGCAFVGVGFPGEFSDGCVVRPGNLSRPAGIDSEVDPALEHRWRGFALQEELRRSTGLDVRVVNDATMAALGCCEGQGRELVLTLGTGLGIALMVNGVMTRIRDVGAATFRGRTYDEVLGERARARDARQWSDDVVSAMNEFVVEFGSNRVHLAGGNARRLSPGLFSRIPGRVTIEGNEASLRGAARLF